MEVLGSGFEKNTLYSLFVKTFFCRSVLACKLYRFLIFASFLILIIRVVLSVLSGGPKSLPALSYNALIIQILGIACTLTIADRSKAVLLLWTICVFYVLCFSCFCVCPLLPCGHLLRKGWLLGSCWWCWLYCVTFHVVSWIKCCTWLYRFLIWLASFSWFARLYSLSLVYYLNTNQIKSCCLSYTSVSCTWTF